MSSLDDRAFGVVEQRGINAVVDQDGETNLFHGLAELVGEGLLPCLVAAPPIRHVADADLEVLVELLALGGLGQPVALVLVDLLVAPELLVERLDALFLGARHGG